MSASPNEPDEAIAATIVEEFLGAPAPISRFPAGLRHFVFEATCGQDRKIVVRISRREDIGVARNALYWSKKLRPLGVPLPKVLQADMTMDRHPFPFMILERLPGRDLGFVVDRLSRDEQRGLARRLVAVQSIVTELPAGGGYGFAPRLEGHFPHVDWGRVIAASLRRSRKRIRAAGVVSEHHADRVEAAADSHATYFAKVRPTPFLHDITTKNVIVEGARLSGIVDVDDLCFGDPLFLVGLIRTALLANGHGAFYADAWIEALRPDEEQRTALDVYTALFCLDFLAELGNRFNRSAPALVDSSYVERLQGLLDRYLQN